MSLPSHLTHPKGMKRNASTTDSTWNGTPKKRATLKKETSQNREPDIKTAQTATAEELIESVETSKLSMPEIIKQLTQLNIKFTCKSSVDNYGAYQVAAY